MFRNYLSSFIAFIFLFTSLPANPAGLLVACTDGTLDCEKSERFQTVYKSSGSTVDVLYRADPGSLGDISAGEAAQAINDTLDTFNNVQSSKINFVKSGDGFLSVDVNENNFSPFLEPSSPLGYSPIILDSDGQLFESFFGQGTKTSILGFGGPNFISVSQRAIVESQAAFNGYLFTVLNRPSFSTVDDALNDFKSTILHEFGHMIGLDHTQIFSEDYTALQTNPGQDTSDIPIMFPVLVNKVTEFLTDDIASVSVPYPSTSFVGSFGTIKGHLLNQGQPVLGANIVAHNISNPRQEAISSASDVKAQEDGEFIISGLSPGDYILKVEPILSQFSGASAVGFHNPASPSEVPTGFFDGVGNPIIQSSTLNVGLVNATRITVAAGETISNIDIDLNPNGEENIPESSTVITPTFRVRGKATKKTTTLRFGRSKVRTVRFKRRNKGKPIIQLSTNFPELISFNKNNFQLKRKNPKETVKVTFAAFEDFATQFPALAFQGALVTITAVDTTTGYTETINLSVQ